MTREPKRVLRFGDIITVKHFGNRPGIVISAESHNATALDVVAMVITTKEQHAMRGGAIVLDNWKDYGLQQPSIVKPFIFSYDIEDTTWVGHVDENVKGQLRRAMAVIFGGKVRKK